jgi:hypothetical protein
VYNRLPFFPEHKGDRRMKSLIISVAVVVAVLLIAFLRNLKRQPAGASKPPAFKTTEEFVEWLASEAVKDAEKENHLTLDYTPDSIQVVERILGELHEKYVKRRSSVAVRGLAAAYGAYIGEVIRRSEPDVHWERDDPNFGEKVFPLIWKAGRSFPMGWCQKRIENGKEDNVWVKYSVLKKRRAQAGN